MARTLALARPDASHYTWSFPGSPVNVQLSLDVVERLQTRLEDSATSPGDHGILWGRAVGQKTEVKQFTTIPSHQPSSIREAASRPAAELQPVGYYRFHWDATLRMNDDDVALAHSVFSEPGQVFLLIQPGETSPATATFFFWDQGRLCGDFPFLEFPLDRALLANAELQRSLTLEKKRAPQIRQEIGLPPETHAPQKFPSKTRRLSLLLLGGLLVTACTAAGFRFLPEMLWKPASPASRPPVVAVSPSPIPLGLQADRHNGDLRLSWNRESGAVRNATAGVLEIEDGETTRKINLDPTQVRTGSILYAPTSGQIQFQLTVQGQQTTSESVLVILPASQDAKVKTLATTKEVPAAIASDTKPESDSGEKARHHPAKQFVASERRGASNYDLLLPSEPPSLTSKAADPVSIAAGLGEPLTTPPLTRPTAPPAATFETPAPPTATAAPRSTTPEPIYYPPVVAGSVNPVYPPELRSLGLAGKTVEVKVSLDETGKVIKAEALTPKAWTPNAMIQSSLTAVRLWKFRPARKGNQTVPSEMVVQFSFKGFR